MKELEEMAEGAGMDRRTGWRDSGEMEGYWEAWPEQLSHFAALVAAKEREALRSRLEELRASGSGAPNPYHRFGYDAGLAAAQRSIYLRARGATDGK